MTNDVACEAQRGLPAAPPPPSGKAQVFVWSKRRRASKNAIGIELTYTAMVCRCGFRLCTSRTMPPVQVSGSVCVCVCGLVAWCSQQDVFAADLKWSQASVHSFLAGVWHR